MRGPCAGASSSEGIQQRDCQGTWTCSDCEELGAAAIVMARRRAVASCRRVVVASSLYSVVLGER